MSTKVSNEKIAEVLEEWKTQVYDQSEAIDPEQEHDWKSLFLGWCLGKGYTVNQADYLYYRVLEKGII